MFLTEIIGQISYVFLNYTQLTRVVADKMPLYNVHNLKHRAQVMTTFLNEIPLKMRQGYCVTL